MLDFVIPMSKDDLLVETAKRYYVRNVARIGDLPQLLTGCKEALNNEGIKCIPDHFDALFSVLVHFSRAEWNMLPKAWDVVSLAFKKMTTELDRLLRSNELETSTRLLALNATKMIMYLFTQMMRGFEDRLANYGKGKDKFSRPSESEGFNWQNHSHSALIALYESLQLPLRQLWDPPCAEDNFSNLVGNACFKALEDPGVTQAKNKPMRETVFQILGTLVKKYNYGFSCIVRIGQMLNLYEHLISPMVRLVLVLLNEFECHSIVREMVVEVARLDPNDASVTPASTRTQAQFIVELSEEVPGQMAPYVDLLVPLLDGESHVMRNAVLSVMGVVVQTSLSQENLSAELKEQRDELLECLLEHIHDTNSFVRSKVLQIWRRLLRERCIPISLQAQVLKLTVGRLKDKTSSVKKYAVQLVAGFLEENPFAARLGLDDLKSQLETEKKVQVELDIKVKSLESGVDLDKLKLWDSFCPDLLKTIKKYIESDDMDSDAESIEEGDKVDVSERVGIVISELQDGHYLEALKTIQLMEDQVHPDLQKLKPSREDEGYVEYYLQLLRTVFVCGRVDSEAEAEKQGQEKQQPEEDWNKKLDAQNVLVDYLQDSISFVETMNTALPAICHLLNSMQVSDIVEAVEFFTAAQQFGLAEAEKCMCQLLTLVLSREKGIQTAVGEAYKKTYLVTEGLTGRAEAEKKVQNLINLIMSVDISQGSAMKELVRGWVTSGDLSVNCFQVMWDIFSMVPPNRSGEDSLAALMLLDMVASTSPEIVRSHLTLLVTEGFGKRGEADFRLVSATCRILQRMAPAKPPTSGELSVRFPTDHEMFVSLCRILKNGFRNLDDPHYSPMAADGIDLIYQLSQEPEAAVEELLGSLCGHLMGSKPQDQCDNDSLQCDVRALSRLLYVVGHVAMRHMIFLDTAVYAELKRRSTLKKGKAETQRQKKRDRNRMSNMSTMSTVSNADSVVNETMGTQSEDRDAEMIRHICESELVTGNTVLANLSSLIVNICSDPVQYTDITLRRAAFLALSKVMTVSSTLCSEHMQLFVTVLGSSTDETIRSNALIAMADIAFRFPNVVEPWTSHMYDRLRDEAKNVRQTAVMILTHLVMNDMVKIRSQIADLTLCLVDADESIARVAKVFFLELSQKGNALYNALPDIISQLSSPQLNLDEAKFKKIFKFVLGMITKERQIGTLVEKLCQRFRASSTDRQASDLAYCLSLVQYSEASMRRLVENVPCFSDKLHIQGVYDSFQTILSNTGRDSKEEMKALQEELKALIDECLKRGTENADGDPMPMPTKTPSKSRVRSTAKTPAKGRLAGGKTPAKTPAGKTPAIKTPASKRVNPPRGRRTRKVVTSSSSASEDSE